MDNLLQMTDNTGACSNVQRKLAVDIKDADKCSSLRILTNGAVDLLN